MGVVRGDERSPFSAMARTPPEDRHLMFVVNPENSLAVISDLADAGVRFTIDDFGTGYSSLAYLKRLPVHQIKIDRSFVVDMLDAGNDRSIVSSVVDLGHNLGLQVVAEGVEDELTLHLLRGTGCDLAQGYHLGRSAVAQALEVSSQWLQ